ncbi:hypothetical protein FD13_GL000107 [Levilactobacillus senmaizukei DSM 21775 = NBRC 103853]|uniref:Uncharacterized protein n=2 Tax=Levilactobacillus senmaizukei TaxID=431273 RepID=A0A0R2DSB6_9LACO|nr:hypothetical protein FD13_GL000107 [Levilactobacillus senmaizukei DSM 21775 = NBRC 103853]
MVAAWLAWLGVTDTLYQIIPSEPIILTLGVVVTMISLIGISRTARRCSQGWLVPATVVAFFVATGLLIDLTLLGFGLTIPGFY